MSDTSPVDNAELIKRPEQIHGYSYGTDQAARSPLTLKELDHLRSAVGLVAEDVELLHSAGEILAPLADEMVTAWREKISHHQHLARYSAHPDGKPNPNYGAASKPRFDRWIIDACTRPLDQDWLNYQHEIGLRHTRDKKNLTDHADSADHIPLRYLLAFTSVVITTSRDYLARGGGDPAEIDRMHAAFTKSVMLHVTVWTRPYVPAANW